jgi:hypothetical protein
MGSKSKRQMTQAKRAREQTLIERRLRKQEKKQAAAARRAEATAVVPEGVGGEAGPSPAV